MVKTKKSHSFAPQSKWIVVFVSHTRKEVAS
jgi:hypothetical protein